MIVKERHFDIETIKQWFEKAIICRNIQKFKQTAITTINEAKKLEKKWNISNKPINSICNDNRNSNQMKLVWKIVVRIRQTATKEQLKLRYGQ